MIVDWTYTLSQGGGGGGGYSGLIIMLGLMFAIMYFMIIRPQKRKQKEHEELLKRLKSGDRVVTAGGIHGIVQTVKKNTVLLKIDEKSRIEMSMGSITQVVRDEDEKSEDEEEKK